MRRLVVGVLAVMVVGLVATPSGADAAPRLTGVIGPTVLRVSDVPRPVRLIGVRSPRQACWRQRAIEHLERYEGRRVRLGPEQRVGRTAYRRVRVRGVDLGRQLVRRGLARTTAGAGALERRLQRQARARGVGDWGACPSSGPSTGTSMPLTSDGKVDIGEPPRRELWVDPARGSDDNTGTVREQALSTLAEAWRRIPASSPLNEGVRIRLVAGTYGPDQVPNYWEHRWGSPSHPIWIDAADGPGTVTLPALNIFDTRHLYLIGLRLVAAGGDTLHCEQCEGLLVRDSTILGERSATRETIKVNQSRLVWIEQSTVTGAEDNTIDFVAVNDSHVVGSTISSSGDWCVYAKGGSTRVRVDRNRVFDCGTGGISAGQGTGFQYMTAPYLHYETNQMRITNNTIHDVWGAGVGVNGGLNTLIAHNTMARVGSRSHVVEVTYGLRSCDPNPAEEPRCAAHRSAGGWGPPAPIEEEVRIPNRNTVIANNVILNPPGLRSAWQHFAIPAAVAGVVSAGLPGTIHADSGLVITGNLILNGQTDHALGIDENGDGGAGCGPDSSCNAAQVRRDNWINTVPAGTWFRNPEAGDWRLPAPIAAAHPVARPPDFPLPIGTLIPDPALTPPAGGNAVPTSAGGLPRGFEATPGAW